MTPTSSHQQPGNQALLALGANVGDREANLRLALRLLSQRCMIVRVSSLYRSPALVLEGAPGGPDYVNAACEVTTDLAPHDLLAFAKEIEHAIGRRPAPRWSPRPIDIDIALYGDTVSDDATLTIPHPALHERAFVLIPLAELAPDAMHPTLHRTIGELAEDIDTTGLTHLKTASEWWPEPAPHSDDPEDPRLITHD